MIRQIQIYRILSQWGLNVYHNNYEAQFFFIERFYKTFKTLIIPFYTNYSRERKMEKLPTSFIDLMAKLDREEKLSDNSLTNIENKFK